MASKKIDKNSQERTTTPQLRICIIPTFSDEDPERTPERWWLRRQNQGSTLL
ncbi:MAG: hypothetical protein U7123_18785 [Potamolinea sp.]